MLARHGPVKGLPEHRSWRAMIRRCRAPADKDYARYGGRGIRVCERWQGTAGFWRFYLDMGPRPSSGYSVDRIDGDGPYEPGNCRWATSREQCNHRSTSRFVTIDGETLTVAQWARLAGLPRQLVISRLDHGWSPEVAISAPAGVSRADAHRAGPGPANTRPRPELGEVRHA